ncbi:DUF2089 domain-containing protein [Halobacillus salinarum]|uniref:DUF2089 domain-containing protein n=1 Tax=Halobacillus salinarum TaxID=2932257 RepID=A0ABY4EKD7_9BACI|nr:DUF2089 family protein [Halobacillus salinarum]UOQ44895.1 DUF2089 domain-containing protein [Halobacillus salinarum]
MAGNNLPKWILDLDSEDLEFIRKFVLYSGSLKQIAKSYDVSYPTVRTRLDRLIQKIELNQDMDKAGFVNFVKQLAIEDRISLDEAKLIIEKYKSEKEDEKNE